MGLDALTAQVQITTAWQAQKVVTGFQPNSKNDGASKKLTTVIGGAIASGANEVYSALLSITNGAPQTLDLTALTDVLGNTLNFARIRAWFVWLLAATDTAPDGTTAGNACSGVTIGNAASNQWAGTGYPVSDQATGTQTIGNGEFRGGGTPVAAGWLVDGTHKQLKCACNDAGNVAKLVLVLVGSDT